MYLLFTACVVPNGDTGLEYYDGDYATSETAQLNLLAGIHDGVFETGDVLQVLNNETGAVLWWHTVTATEDRTPNEPDEWLDAVLTEG